MGDVVIQGCQLQASASWKIQEQSAGLIAGDRAAVATA
jgi:hypothetical protein